LTPENRNLLPEITEQEKAPAPAASEGAGGAPAASAPGTAAPAPSPAETAPSLTREEALAQHQRVPIATGTLSGSINLTGARIDDLRLNDYHETIDPKSPTIVLLSPSGAPDAYFAEFGWIAQEAAGPMPGPDTVWSAPAGAKLTSTTPVTLTYDNGAGLTFTRTISVDDNYMFAISDAVANSGDSAVSITPFGRVTRIGEPQASSYWILHEGPIGVFGDQGLKEVKYKGIKKDGEQDFKDVTGGWLGITDKYWAATIIPDPTAPYDGRFLYSDQTTPLYQADFRGAATSVAPGATVEETNHLFAGAKVVTIVDGYRDSLNIKLFDRLIDWGWFYFITKPMFHLIDFFYKLFGNFGVAILAVTVLVKAAFFPLANKSYKSMSAMKKLQPKIQELKELYKDDKVKQQQAQMELFKKEGANPLAGCWPVAIQIPVFFSLYKVLFVTIEMRHAPFFGWIHDLSAKDPTNVFTLFGLIPWDPTTLPFFGGLLVLGAWPLIMGVTMFVQMKLNPTPPDPAQQMIFTWMPVIFTFMLSSFPAGLVIYWAWNNTLSVTQQYIIMRRQGVDVDLMGNILNTFRRKPAATPAAPAAVARPAVEDDGEEAEEAAPPPPRKASKAKKPAGRTKARKAGAKARG
jgi:YidC/Oxa1 family membrane protein insertase